MRLGKFFKIVLFSFDVVLLVFIINSFVREYNPVNRPLYWIGVIVEIGVGWLAYWFWMRSLLVKGFKIDRIMSIIMIILGFGLPNLYNVPGLNFLHPSGPADLFFYFTAITLILYSSYTVDKYLARHKNERSNRT